MQSQRVLVVPERLWLCQGQLHLVDTLNRTAVQMRMQLWPIGGTSVFQHLLHQWIL